MNKNSVRIDREDGLFDDIGDKPAREKTSQSL
jgi:hypothetical protein